MVVAVDGPAASGKGTLARKIAERLGYAYLDTGALYRAVALAALEMGSDPSRIEDVRPAIDIVLRNLTLELLSSPALRRPEVSEAASKVAALPEVRKELLAFQRAFAENPPGDVGGAVLDGRDIGTVVCPDADVKFFVTAKPEERAQRRFRELQWSHPLLTLEGVLADLLRRDQRDSGRDVAPATPADDAYLLDTTKLSPPEVLDTAIHTVRQKLLTVTDARS
ncbi:MAG: (d)CMP kinase [Alphaproteobacteria bacterium]|nr:(d)CMP kinase [Alphaproteobacteria bacterium]MDE2336630.1 (d)CMP kinase [Alphaproteobacteria bacterium]